MPNETSPDWFNKADNAWQLTAATLVGLQSIPGLMILYGGGVKKKWALNFLHLWISTRLLEFLPFWGKANVDLDQKYLLTKAFL
ncbi:hypothetical protein SADUNF_Sadunf06G0199000 [Salix dunnii]|uniref:Uncharacterized protein n=1 Tax=Salix dunnii TaxID=1413687 RepID=A0A835K368_9ROSI|nr:hypothetical protein SADUNF_Sadunf06G0199000 [Salix dunnii]